LKFDEFVDKSKVYHVKERTVDHSGPLSARISARTLQLLKEIMDAANESFTFHFKLKNL
jgi:hypothetical protein